jgi:hypothetical protein
VYPLPSLWLAHDCLGECLIVFALIITKVIADLPPEEVAINDGLVCLLSNLFGGMVPFRDEALVILNATCSLEWCNFRVKVGLEEERNATICQEQVSRPR